MINTTVKKAYDINLYLFAKFEEMTKSTIKLQ